MYIDIYMWLKPLAPDRRPAGPPGGWRRGPAAMAQLDAWGGRALSHDPSSRCASAQRDTMKRLADEIAKANSRAAAAPPTPPEDAILRLALVPQDGRDAMVMSPLPGDPDFGIHTPQVSRPPSGQPLVLPRVAAGRVPELPWPGQAAPSVAPSVAPLQSWQPAPPAAGRLASRPSWRHRRAPSKEEALLADAVRLAPSTPSAPSRGAAQPPEHGRTEAEAQAEAEAEAEGALQQRLQEDQQAVARLEQAPRPRQEDSGAADSRLRHGCEQELLWLHQSHERRLAEVRLAERARTEAAEASRVLGDEESRAVREELRQAEAQLQRQGARTRALQSELVQERRRQEELRQAWETRAEERRSERARVQQDLQTYKLLLQD